MTEPFLTSLPRFGSGWFANHALQRLTWPSRRGCNPCVPHGRVAGLGTRRNRITHRTMKKILAIIMALLGLILGVAAYWLFFLINGNYAITRRDGTPLYGISTSRGLLIFVADLVVALLLLWLAFRLFRRDRSTS